MLLGGKHYNLEDLPMYGITTRRDKMAKTDEKPNRVECKDCLFWNPKHRKLTKNNWKRGVCEKNAPIAIAMPIVTKEQFLVGNKLTPGHYKITQIIQNSCVLPAKEYEDACYEGVFVKGAWKKRNVLFRKFI